MPELPEVETVRRGLAPAMEGATIAAVALRRPDLRFPLPENFAARLTGRRITGLGRRAKYLTASLDDGETLVCHLGMSGSFRVEMPGETHLPGDFHYARSRDEAHDHVVFDLDQPQRGRLQVIYNDPRRFGFMFLARQADLDGHRHLAGLGVEPTGNALDGAWLAARVAGRKAPLKALLLDQRIIAGLGNIYVSEALWRAGLSPERAGATLAGPDGATTPAADRLAIAIRAVIADAIEAGGSTLRDHMRTDGTLGYFQHSFSVYDREGDPCPRLACNGVVRRIVQSGRSTFCCPACQK